MNLSRIEKAQETRIELAKENKVPESSIVWLGGDNFIVCLNDGEVRVSR